MYSIVLITFCKYCCYLQSNRLLKIENLEALTQLDQLYISHNGLQSIDNLPALVSQVTNILRTACYDTVLSKHGEWKMSAIWSCGKIFFQVFLSWVIYESQNYHPTVCNSMMYLIYAWLRPKFKILLVQRPCFWLHVTNLCSLDITGVEHCSHNCNCYCSLCLSLGNIVKMIAE